MSKRKKSRRTGRRTSRTERSRIQPILFPGGSLTLDGRNIISRSHVSPGDHASRVAHIAESIPESEATRDELRSKLDEMLTVVAPLDCLALASAMYLLKDPDTYSEAEDDRSPAHIEFLALSVLPMVSSDSEDTSSSVEPTPAPELFGEGTFQPSTEGDTAAHQYWRAAALAKASDASIALVRELFLQSTDLIWQRYIVKANEPGVDVGREELRREAQLQSTNIRGAAYHEHLSLVLHGTLGDFDLQCRELLGFTAAEAWTCGIAVGSIMSRRVQARADAVLTDYTAMERRVRQLRRKKALPKHLAGLSPTKQKDWLMHRAHCEHFADPLDLLTITPAQLSDETCEIADAEAHENTDPSGEGDFAPAVGVGLDAATAWFTALTCDPVEYEARFHRQPCGEHPLTRRPALKVPGGYLVPSPTTIADALRPLMEDALKAGPGDAWSRYDRHRATWVEEVATGRLAAALPGSQSWSSVKWSSIDDQSDLDGLVACDDFAARLQCKAGRVSASARRGAPSMKEDIQAVINDAAHQHARLARALRSAEAATIGFGAEQAAALDRPLTVEVIVCLDDVTVWSTQTHKLRHLVALPEQTQLPWVLSLTDLFAVTDVLQGPELVHYITRRLRLETEERVSAHDELDWLGNYISDGLYFDDHFESDQAPDHLRLMSFTGQFDTWYLSRAGMTSQRFPRPRQPLPINLRKFLTRLQRERPRHWLTASLVLLNGDSEVRNQVVTLMAHLRDRAAREGTATGTHLYADYTLTFLVDRTRSGRALTAALRTYWASHIRTHGRPSGIAIGVGADDRIVIEVVETDPSLTLSHALLRRRPAASIASEHHQQRPSGGG